MREFIRRNREAITAYILRVNPREQLPLNDGEREMWVLNDAGLYQWARSEGVKI